MSDQPLSQPGFEPGSRRESQPGSQHAGTLSRRDFLRQTVAFSALGAMGAGTRLLAEAQAGPGGPSPAPDPANTHMFMIGDWGSDKQPGQQMQVANAMKGWVDQRKIRPEALFLLGDNWYGNMVGGVQCERWQSGFEQMYPTSHFPGPCYAVLGNHDYEFRVENKAYLQLAYPQQVKTRWTMPAKWYTFDFPEKSPAIKFICLDSNLPGTKSDPFPWSVTMSKDHMKQQDEWFHAELSKPRTVPFLAVVAHHPLFNNGIHKDNKLLLEHWGQWIRDAKVDFWLTGHDHDLQHLEFAGHPTSFVISGGGGAELDHWTTDPSQRGPFGNIALGFSDMEFTSSGIIHRLIDGNGKGLHAFRKQPGAAAELFTAG